MHRVLVQCEIQGNSTCPHSRELENSGGGGVWCEEESSEGSKLYQMHNHFSQVVQTFRQTLQTSITIWILVLFIVSSCSAEPTALHVPTTLRLEPRAQTASTLNPFPTQATLTLISATTTGAGAAALATASASDPLPQPFDTSLGNNFTTPSCPQFFKNFLNDKDFVQCYPFSLLLQTSAGFFAVEKSFIKTTQTIDASCSVNRSKCSNLMSSLAGKIRSQDNCGADYSAQNPLVIQAYIGLSAYNVMYQAACQRDGSGSYCFANAITNTNVTADSYPYFLPLGVSLPQGSRPSCSACTKSTMQVLSNAAKDPNQLISRTYPDAAQRINSVCGTDWLPVKVKMNEAVGRTVGSGSAILVALFAAIFVLR